MTETPNTYRTLTNTFKSLNSIIDDSKHATAGSGPALQERTDGAICTMVQEIMPNAHNRAALMAVMDAYVQATCELDRLNPI